jgi:RimJ/RimL family protein N-acetyltransferase
VAKFTVADFLVLINPIGEYMTFDPYQQCPIYQSKHFLLRLVAPTDAQDLLSCYSDPLAAPLFNSDNCTSDFIYHTHEEMQDCINFWLDEYAKGYYIRFSIIDTSTQKAIGTIECFTKQETYKKFKKVAVLRLDLVSAYETTAILSELLQLIDKHFFDCFTVNTIITKAVPLSQARISVLSEMGYIKLNPNPIMPYPDYYAKIKENSY